MNAAAFAEEASPPGARAAATLVVMRPATDSPSDCELLMVKRAASMAFAGGAVVFPGGRVDPDDAIIGPQLAPHLHPADAAARVAAIRETIEETGLAVGLPGCDSATVQRLRAGLSEGHAFSALLERERLMPRLADLHPFARWCPNLPETRTFDTRFYAAMLPAEHAEISVEGFENTEFFWSTAAAMLRAADQGEYVIIFPTRRNLERLASAGNLAGLTEGARTHSIATITPWIERRGGEEWLCIPTDQGYPVCAERLSHVRRG